MEELKKLTEDMWDELHGAKHYAEHALKLKDVDAARSNMYANMSRQELEHYDTLHKMAVKHVAAHGDDHTAKMVWDWECGKLHDKLTKIKVMLEMAK